MCRPSRRFFRLVRLDGLRSSLVWSGLELFWLLIKQKNIFGVFTIFLYLYPLYYLPLFIYLRMNPVPENNQKTKKKRQSYSTDYKIAIAADLVPSNLLSLIPRSTIHGIKNYDFSKLIGYDMVIEKVQMLKNIARHEDILRIGNAALRVKNTIIKMMTVLKSNKIEWHEMKK